MLLFNAGAYAIAGAYDFFYTVFTNDRAPCSRQIYNDLPYFSRTLISFVIDALIIPSTIYAQDLHDEVGDKFIG